jgi:hypothetical protein
MTATIPGATVPETRDAKLETDVNVGVCAMAQHARREQTIGMRIRKVRKGYSISDENMVKLLV